MGNIEWIRIHPIRGAWWHYGRVSDHGSLELCLKQTVAMQCP